MKERKLAGSTRRYLEELWKIRRSCWALATIMHFNGLPLRVAYKITKGDFRKSDRYNPTYEWLEIPMGEYTQISSLNTQSKKGFLQWCKGRKKPSIRTVKAAFDCAACLAGVELQKPEYWVKGICKEVINSTPSLLPEDERIKTGLYMVTL